MVIYLLPTIGQMLVSNGPPIWFKKPVTTQLAKVGLRVRWFEPDSQSETKMADRAFSGYYGSGS